MQERKSENAGDQWFQELLRQPVLLWRCRYLYILSCCLSLFSVTLLRLPLLQCRPSRMIDWLMVIVNNSCSVGAFHFYNSYFYLPAQTAVSDLHLLLCVHHNHTQFLESLCYDSVVFCFCYFNVVFSVLQLNICVTVTVNASVCFVSVYHGIHYLFVCNCSFHCNCPSCVVPLHYTWPKIHLHWRHMSRHSRPILANWNAVSRQIWHRCHTSVDSGDLNQAPPKQSAVCSTCIIPVLPVNYQFIWMACAFGMSATQPILGWL